MERRAKDLMQILDDELDHHPKGYVYRNYDVYSDYLTAAKERYPPLINLIINNPNGRVSKSRPRYSRPGQDDEFGIIIRVMNPPYLGPNLDQFLTNNQFKTAEFDREINYVYYGKGKLCKGEICGELTLNNYDLVFKNMIGALKSHGWKKLSERMLWLYDIFKKVYTGLPPAQARPRQGHLF